jgi:hypothetical protein
MGKGASAPLFIWYICIKLRKIMASVNRVYTALKDLANKDQRGFITPAIFNNFAGVAQMNIFNQLFDDVALAKRLRNSALDGKLDKGRMKQIEEDLATFSKSATISLTVGVGSKPSDLARIISLNTTASPSKSVPIVYDEVNWENILRSTLSAPTADYPAALLTNEIEVAPTSIASVKLRYYKQPQGLVPSTGARTASQPRFGYTVAAGKEVYSSTNSVDFELPEHYFADLVVEIAKLVGVNLRDQDVYAYAQGEQKSNI